MISLRRQYLTEGLCCRLFAFKGERTMNTLKLYRNFDLCFTVKSLLEHLHMKFIRFVACDRSLICGVHFVDGITLSKDTKNAYIWDCHFDGTKKIRD